MGRNASRQLVTVAQITGTCAGYGQGEQYTRDEALTEIAGILAQAKVRPGSEAAVALLSTAAAQYIVPTGPGDANWYPAALALLVDAGADMDRARAIEAAGRGRTARIR